MQSSKGSSGDPHHVINVPYTQTAWANLWDNDVVGVGISKPHKFHDHLARSSWTVMVSGIGSVFTGLTATVILEGTFDGTNYNTISTTTVTSGNQITVTNTTGVTYAQFRARVTALNLGSAEAIRVGLGASGT